MPTFNFAFLHEDDATPVDATNKLDFGRVDPGLSSPIIRFHLWNDKAGAISADTAVAPRLYAIADPDDVSIMFTGTPINDMQSMLEARSCRASGVAADQHTDWSPLRPDTYLVMGDMPSNSMREIEIRLRVPADAAPMTPAKDWQLRITA